MGAPRSTRTRPLPQPADEALATALERVLVAALEPPVRVEDLRRLSGGASRETFAFDAVQVDGTTRPLVLQRERPGGAINTGGGTRTEAGLLRAAAAQGVPVPAVVATGPADVARAGEGDGQPLGAAYLVVERLEGETIPRRILRDEQYAAARPTSPPSAVRPSPASTPSPSTSPSACTTSTRSRSSATSSTSWANPTRPSSWPSGGSRPTARRRGRRGSSTATSATAT